MRGAVILVSEAVLLNPKVVSPELNFFISDVLNLKYKYIFFLFLSPPAPLTQNQDACYAG